MNPEELKFTKEHEWVMVENNIATMGITDYAQAQLGDITYVELPRAGDDVEQLSEMGVIESIKAASDVYAPVSGKVVEVNAELSDKPEAVNQDPYGEGWLARIEMKNPGELESLLSHEQYQELTKEEE